MENIKIVWNENNFGEIQLYSDDVKVGKMDVSIQDVGLVVYHTEVGEAYSGRGFAKLLLEKLVGLAREKGLKVVPLCPYVHAQFKRHPDDYQDVWSLS